MLYSRQGVQEYWIADWRHHNVQVFCRTEQGLTLGDGDTITTPLLPGFEMSVATLWEPES